jgi:alginate O-acetyltransferase complex protein AlgI
MVFSSPIFLFLFLPVCVSLYLMIHPNLRNAWLLATSLVFYAWGEGSFIWVLLASITANYLLGLFVGASRGRFWPKLAIVVAVLTNLGLLAFFKYANFLVENWNSLRTTAGFGSIKVGHVHLPLGISFFTFHALSYVIDVYRREVKSLRNPLHFALYISFFPQAIAGPIVRFSHVAPQLVGRVLSRAGFALGVQRLIIGLAKKMLVANTLAAPADAIFRLPATELTGALAWLGVACYTLQIYFDFSGYSDMAIGLARMFGFEFPENFNYPYVAGSITEFWKRWHISLSSWYRDYLYIPLGGNRRGTARLYVNLLLVFFLCGLWHGASWTFVAWGLYHGTFLVVERWGLGALLEKRWLPLRSLYTLPVVMVGWVFFKSETFTQAAEFLTAMAGFGSGCGLRYYPAIYLNSEVVLMLSAGVLGCFPLGQFAAGWRRSFALPSQAEGGIALASVVALALLFAASAMQLAAGTYNPFIYYRF